MVVLVKMLGAFQAPTSLELCLSIICSIHVLVLYYSILGPPMMPAEQMNIGILDLKGAKRVETRYLYTIRIGSSMTHEAKRVFNSGSTSFTSRFILGTAAYNLQSELHFNFSSWSYYGLLLS